VNADDFARIALDLAGAEEHSHMGARDFRVGGRIFATLAHGARGLGNLMLTRDMQQELIDEMPDIFLPVHGGWGRMGSTHVRLAEADEDILAAALQRAWRLRVEKNARTKKAPATKKKKKSPPAKRR
jgi:hypothetical protein